MTSQIHTSYTINISSEQNKTTLQIGRFLVKLCKELLSIAPYRGVNELFEVEDRFNSHNSHQSVE